MSPKTRENDASSARSNIALRRSGNLTPITLAAEAKNDEWADGYEGKFGVFTGVFLFERNCTGRGYMYLNLFRQQLTPAKYITRFRSRRIPIQSRNDAFRSSKTAQQIAFQWPTEVVLPDACPGRTSQAYGQLFANQF